MYYKAIQLFTVCQEDFHRKFRDVHYVRLANPPYISTDITF